MPSLPPPPTTTAALCPRLWRRTELHQRWDTRTSSLNREWLQSIRDSACASYNHVWFADIKQKSSQLSLSFSVQTLSHLSELLSICLVVQHLISSPVCFLCLHLSCPSVTRLRSSLSPVYVWFNSTRAVCLCALACRMERRTTVHSNRLLKRLCGQWCTLPEGCLHALCIILLLRRLESLTFFHTVMG